MHKLEIEMEDDVFDAATKFFCDVSTSVSTYANSKLRAFFVHNGLLRNRKGIRKADSGDVRWTVA
jgi:hypothetical protein